MNNDLQKSYIFISAPYSEIPESVVDVNMKIMDAYVTRLLTNKKFCVSLLSMIHPLMRSYNHIPQDGAFWYPYSEMLVSKASELHVLELPGYEGSKGIKLEINVAKEYGIPVVYVSMPSLLQLYQDMKYYLGKC